MKKLEIVSGSIEQGKWEIHDSSLNKGKYVIKKIPINDIVGIDKIEQAGRTIYINVTLGTGGGFVARMGVGAYKKLYGYFLSYGNSPISESLPIEKVSILELVIATIAIVFIIMIFI